MITGNRSLEVGGSHRAIITGIRGQDAQLLCRLLQSHGWEVLGTDRPVLALETAEFQSIPLDLSDRSAVQGLVGEWKPDCIFHLAAAHHSSEQTSGSELDQDMVRINFSAAEAWLLAITRSHPRCRLLLAGSSQMYLPIHAGVNMINEETPSNPSTFYGHTKAWSRTLLDHYRRQRGVYGSMVILFNHESPLRGPQFLTRKVTMAAARAAIGQPAVLRIRNIGAAVDWSSAQDFVEAMVRALTAADPADYVLASGRATKVEEILSLAFGTVGLDWREHTMIEGEPGSNQPVLVGDASRARRVLGWSPREPLSGLIARMVEHDVRLLKATNSRTL